MSATNALRTATKNSPAQQRERTQSFPAMLESFKGEIARALPKHLNPDTMMRIALTAFRMTPKLKQCHPASVFAAVIQASQLGLRPNMLGECYLIPYKDECQLQIGYQGLLQLARNSGFVTELAAYLVYENDEYEVQFGTDPGIKHRPFLGGARGEVVFGYAIAKLKGGGIHVEVMPLAEILAIRDRSQNVQNARKWNKKTPWDTDFDEMSRKTLIRRICKYLPKSNEMQVALSLENAAESGTQGLSVDDAIGNTFSAANTIDMDDGIAPPGFDEADEQDEVEAPEPAPAPRAKPKPRARQASAPQPELTESEDPAPTYAEIMDQINAAQDTDDLEQARSLLHAGLPGDQATELRAALEQRANELNQE